ncbi:hypothetical protein [Shouchella clausii]|uniref:hypothetical protein n=1 Tax=Shouchella clausii TaxID=79880 RepID=UPI001C73AD6F|nr:hypothetical protein [Shouchella clausii]MBX0319767.1 hypothetical protein [Shouchella clausii]
MSKATELIELGSEVIKRNSRKSTYGDYYITGVEYEEWIARVVFFMDDNKGKFPKFLYDKVIKSAEEAVGNGPEHFEAIVGVLKVYAEREE